MALYIADGYKRDRNKVVLGNSDPAVVAFTDAWLGRLSTGSRTYSLQYHADQDPAALCTLWGRVLGVEGEAIRIQRKSNSRQLAGRRWRSVHGVLSVRVCDTVLRARLQAWMGCMRGHWLSCPPTGV